MQLSTQSPQIQDYPSFLQTLAAELERMHDRKEAHGNLSMHRLAEWVNDAGAFDTTKFEQSRASSECSATEQDPLHNDVRCFARLAVELIAGPTIAAETAFQAANHLGKGWPDDFLHMVEEVIQSELNGTTTGSMSALSQALQEPVRMVQDSTNERSEFGSNQVEPDPLQQPAASTDVVAAESGDTPKTAPSAQPKEHAVPVPNSSPQQPVLRIALRNATVGKPYSYEPGKIAAAIAAQFGDDPALAYISHLQLPEDCGLVFDTATGSLSGVPTRPFEQELSLHYCASRSASGVAAKVTLLINPDPASLWKDQPQPTDAPYQKPPLDHHEEIHGPFRIVAASRRGRSHAQKAEFRDDDYAIGYAAETGWLVVIVADGAGSAIYSRRGSQLACETAKNYLSAALNSAQHNQTEALYSQHRDWNHPEVRRSLRGLLYAAAYKAHVRLTEEVQAPAEDLPKQPTLRNFDTTLIILAMKKSGEGVVVASFAIGDGGAGILTNPDEGRPLTRADSGEHAGQTIFLTFPSTLANTEENLESRFQLEEVPKFAGALAMTDGITDPKFPSDAAFADPAQWAALWAELQPALTSSETLLDWMNFFSPGNHDDRTLVAILPAPPATPATP